MTATTKNENLFQLTGIGVVQTDMATGRFTRANRAFCEMVGYSQEELQGMTNAELTHPEDWERDGERFAALQRGELHEDTAVTRVLHKDGHTVWLELNITLMGEGEQAVNLAVVNDVTERNQAEEALRDAEARFRNLVEPFAQAIWETDAQGQVVADSPSWRAYTGQSLESWLGEGWANAVHPDDRAYALRQWREAVRAGTVVDAEFRLRSPEGGWRWTNVRAAPLLGDDGKVERWAGLNIDISERKQAEVALRESDERHTFLLSLSDALRRETSIEAVGNRAVGMIAETLGLDRVYLVSVTPGDDNIVVTHEVRRADMPPLLGSYRGSDFPNAMKEIFERTIVYEDVRTDPRLGELDRQSLAGLGAVGFIAAPILRGGGEMIWAGGGLSTQPRSWSANEVALFEDAIERAWMAVERVRAEKALAESEEEYRTLFETMGQGYCDLELVRDERGRAVDHLYLELNPAYERLIGIPVSEAKGRTASEVMPELEPWWTEMFGRIADRGEPERIEYEVASLGRWFEVFVYPRGRDRLTVLYEDSTERKQAELSLTKLNETLEQRVEQRTEELERSNTRFSQAFTLAPFPALISTLDRQETFLEVNEAFLEFTRYRREQIVGKQAFDLKMWSSTHDQKKLAEAQKDGRGFRNLALQLKDSEGNLLDVLLSAEVIRIDGHHGYLKMFYDVTEQKRNDEQMTLAVDSVMAEASWFSQEFVGRLNHLRSGGRLEDYRPLDLSPREREVLIMVARGWTNKRISEELDLKQQTIRNYLSSIFDKIGVHSRTEAAVWARKRGLVAD